MTLSDGKTVYFKFMDQGDMPPEYRKLKVYAFEQFDGPTVRYSEFKVRKIRKVPLTGYIKKEIEKQVAENQKRPSRKYWSGKPVRSGTIDIEAVKSLYYRRIIQEKLDEAQKYRDEIAQIKTDAILRWRSNPGRYGVSTEEHYGRYDLDDSPKIRELEAKAVQCERDAENLYRDYQVKLRQ